MGTFLSTEGPPPIIPTTRVVTVRRMEATMVTARGMTLTNLIQGLVPSLVMEDVLQKLEDEHLSPLVNSFTTYVGSFPGESLAPTSGQC